MVFSKWGAQVKGISRQENFGRGGCGEGVHGGWGCFRCCGTWVQEQGQQNTNHKKGGNAGDTIVSRVCRVAEGPGVGQKKAGRRRGQ